MFTIWYYPCLNSSSSRIFAIVKVLFEKRTQWHPFPHTNGEAQQCNQDPPASTSWVWEWRCVPHIKLLLLYFVNSSNHSEEQQLEHWDLIYLPFRNLTFSVAQSLPLFDTLYVYVHKAVCMSVCWHVCNVCTHVHVNIRNHHQTSSSVTLYLVFWGQCF